MSVLAVIASFAFLGAVFYGYLHMAGDIGYQRGYEQARRDYELPRRPRA